MACSTFLVLVRNTAESRLRGGFILMLLIAVGSVWPIPEAWAAGYIPGELYVKYAAGGTAKIGQETPEHAIAALGGTGNRPAFPAADTSPARKATAEQRERLDAVAAIRRVSFPDTYDMELVARKLASHPSIEYAEPVWVDSLCYEPNDPVYRRAVLNAEQEYLRSIGAPDAWERSKGSAGVVIGIVDSGVDWHHPDLAAHVWTNPGEIPGNGLDDDRNGYIDDVHGWDFNGNDSDPVPESQAHGTHVAGIAAAVTDNGVGISSLSYNARFMPVQAGSGTDPQILYGYEGILYAALNGAAIINCSWGSSHFSRAALEVIRAARSQGALIVAAAGNDNRAVPFYPAAYPGVIGVASVTLNGQKSSFSNYGPTVDVAAPGDGIFSTLLENAYGYQSGTSMAAPVVSALAALVLAAHPDWDADYLRAQVVGAAREFPPGFAPLLGSGIIDAVRATGDAVFHLDLAEAGFTEAGGDGILRPGEECTAALELTNTGRPSPQVTVTARSLTGNTIPIQVGHTLGALAHGQTVTFSGLTFRVNGDIPQNAEEIIRFDFSSGDGGACFATAAFVLNPSYATFDANTVELSFGENGTVGFVDFPQNETGSGFVIHGSIEKETFETPLLFEGGLMYGTGPGDVSSAVRGSDPGTAERDFTASGQVRLDRADGYQAGSASFMNLGSLPVSTEFEGFAFDEPGLDQCILLRYTFRNTGQQPIEAMRAGLFLDFDMPETVPENDHAFYMEKDDILVVSEETGTRPDRLMVGIAVLETIGTPWLIKNSYSPAEDDRFFGIYDGFTKEEKWRALSGGKTGLSSISGADVSMVVSPPAFALAAGGSQQRTFIMAYGLGYEDLREQIRSAKERARELLAAAAGGSGREDRPEEFGITGVYPNPFNPATTIQFSIPRDMDGELAVYSVTGQKVRTLLNETIHAGVHRVQWDGRDSDGRPVSSGLYLAALQAEGQSAVQRMTLIR